jgi:predicted RNA-binding protein with PIN domain
MSGLLIIDGHNVVYAVGRYRELKDGAGMEAAVDRLVGDLLNLSGSVDPEIIIVFDGRGPGSAKKISAGLTVMYSAGGKSADQVIERMVFERHREEGLTVCTADYAQQKVIWREKVKRMVPTELMALMSATAEEAKDARTPGSKALHLEDRLPESIRRALDEMRRPE